MQSDSTVPTAACQRSFGALDKDGSGHISLKARTHARTHARFSSLGIPKAIDFAHSFAQEFKAGLAGHKDMNATDVEALFDKVMAVLLQRHAVFHTH